MPNEGLRQGMGSIHQNGDRLREPKVGNTRRPGDEWIESPIDCVGSMSAESESCPTIIFHTVEVCQ